jgi:hypothetical protein
MCGIVSVECPEFEKQMGKAIMPSRWGEFPGTIRALKKKVIAYHKKPPVLWSQRLKTWAFSRWGTHTIEVSK